MFDELYFVFLYVSLRLFIVCGFFTRLLILIFSLLAKRLAGKSAPPPKYLVSNWTLNLKLNQRGSLG